MTFRAVVRDGLIVIDLPDGTPVEVVPVGAPAPRTAGARKAKKKTTKKKAKARARRTSGGRAWEELAAFGIWKDRPEWRGKSSARIAAELRREALGGRRGA